MVRWLSDENFHGDIVRELMLRHPTLGRDESMSDMLTLAEIEAQFVSEWVLIEDPQTNNALEVQSGKVLYHSKDRDEVYREAVRLRPKRFAMLYTGTLPRDTASVL